MKKQTIIIIAVVVAGVAALAAVKLFDNQHKVQEKVYHPDTEKKVLVNATAVTLKNLNKRFVYTGTFKSVREVSLIPQSQGQVKAVYFNEGDLVNEGKLLIHIDDDLLRAQLISAKAAFDIAKRNYERYEKASESDAVSKVQFDNYLQQYKSAESQLKQLDKNIRLNNLIAPFSGTITMRDVEVGSVVGQSSIIGRLTDISQLKLEISVPENEIVLFNKGDNVQIQTSMYPGQELTGNVIYVSGRADDAHNYAVKILTKNDKKHELKDGMYGTAMLTKALNNKVLIIPRLALLGSAKDPQVFVVENGKAVKRNITTGNSNSLELEITGGLKEGDMVVSSGQINLSEGSNVEVVK